MVVVSALRASSRRIMFRSALAVAAALVLTILSGTMSVPPVLAQTAPDAPTAVLANPGDG